MAPRDCRALRGGDDAVAAATTGAAREAVEGRMTCATAIAGLDEETRVGGATMPALGAPRAVAAANLGDGSTAAMTLPDAETVGRQGERFDQCLPIWRVPGARRRRTRERPIVTFFFFDRLRSGDSRRTGARPSSGRNDRAGRTRWRGALADATRRAHALDRARCRRRRCCEAPNRRRDDSAGPARERGQISWSTSWASESS